ncbi:WD40 repeat domain-containing protein [Sedimentitalea sp. XS_ASV28]|uniref:WD40 repeat domain-containing protein n=1 Tax=Sedimentitalea sp. XS_ASV28 TaxID=3241296 RepID=UPI00351975A3
MTQHLTPPSISLFDLIARSWELGSEIIDVQFNVIGSSVAVTLADGTLAFLGVKDGEDPETRMRTEADTGRVTIRPRTKPLPVPVRSDGAIADPDTGLCQVAQQGFAFAHRDGQEIWRATAKGLTLRVAKAKDAQVTALSALPGKRGLLVARGRSLEVMSPENAESLGSAELAHDIRHIALSPGADRLACWGSGHLTILATDGLSPVADIAADGALTGLRWSPDERWLVGGCADKALLLVDVAKGQADRIEGFPAPIASVDFSRKAEAMISSGAFRVVGWRMPDLPFGEHPGLPVETGKPGLTVVETVAAHPMRDLCAVGYANGLITICQIGKREEMMLREGGGDPVNALAWSPDGNHLAIGTGKGKAEIVTFPKAMFK